MPQIELTGTVVEQDSNSPFEMDTSHDGLYLKTDDGRLLELVTGSMAQQIPVEMMWRQSRKHFEPFLGQTVTVQGYLSSRTIYGAMVKRETQKD